MESMQTTPDNTLRPRAFEPLPLGVIKPGGWIADQLRVQANGLTGHLDEFWASIADSRWIGGAHEGWERGPYWLDGVVPLAFLLDDARLKAKAQRWIDHILKSQHEDGWLGPRDDPHEGTGEITLDPWPQFIVFKVLTQWHEATGDERVIPAMLRTARFIAKLLEVKPLYSWGRMRWADFVLSLHWLYERTQEPFLLEIAATVQRQGHDWRAHFANFTATTKTERSYLDTLAEEQKLPWHGVNNAMGIKSGAVWSRQSGDAADVEASLEAIRLLDEHHGQVTGMFSGDEHLAGRDPIQGTETCTVTEYMFTLEQLIALTGEPALGDRLERIAYNALPASMTKDMCQRQYDQQPNQVLCDIQRRDWVSNGSRSNLFSLEGNFGCCTANLHQGFPKFVSHLWMRSGDGRGLAAVAYAPCTVTTTIDGKTVTVREETNYPFEGEIRFTIQTEGEERFPLLLRTPEWANGATLVVGGDLPVTITGGSFHAVERSWQNGDTVVLHLPLALRRETRYRGATALLRGPLVMALRIAERFEQIGGQLPYADYAVHPASPWNYALVEGDMIPASTIRTETPTARPFDTAHPPVVASVAATQLPEWTLTNGSAALPETVAKTVEALPEGTLESVTLVPMGSTHLRITEFPTVTVHQAHLP